MHDKTNEVDMSTLMGDVPRGKDWEFKRAQTRPEARWQNPERIMESAALRYDPENPQGKILIGALGERLIGIADNRHIMTIAGTRAGKSVTVIGNLLFYDGSVWCIDPKGELAEITAARRAALGQKVRILDPFRIVRGKAAKYRAAYNALTVLRLDNPTIIEDAVQIVDALVISSGEEKDPHWNESAAHFLIGLVLYVAVAEDVSEEDRHLGMVRRLVNMALSTEAGSDVYMLPKRALAACDRLARKGHDDLAAAIEGSIRGFYEKSSEELPSVLSTVRRHTQFLDYGAMRRVLSGHSFDLTDLKTDPDGMSVYLCLPATRMEMCNRWLRLLLNQLLAAMEAVKTRPKAPVLVCLDEFPVLGHMRQLQSAAGQIASFDVKLWVILQDWGQGKALYGSRFESFAANAGVLQAFANSDLTTTEYLSRRLGRTLVESARRGEASSSQRRQGISGQTLSLESAALLAPDEVARLFGRSDPHKRQLILWAGLHPMILQRVEYFDEDGPHYGVFAGKFPSRSG